MDARIQFRIQTAITSALLANGVTLPLHMITQAASAVENELEDELAMAWQYEYLANS